MATTEKNTAPFVRKVRCFVENKGVFSFSCGVFLKKRQARLEIEKDFNEKNYLIFLGLTSFGNFNTLLTLMKSGLAMLL